MKNYFIILLITICLVLASFVYKYNRTRICDNFPNPEISKDNNNSAAQLNLYLVFNSGNCRDCLNTIAVLNNLPSHFQIIGLIPNRDYINQKDLRDLTGAIFELRRNDRYKRFMPFYSPTLFGVSNSGKILFMLPAVPNESAYLLEFLENFYSRAYALISDGASVPR